jgi:hypothetical protein
VRSHRPGLIRTIRDRALEGEGPVSAERRSDGIQAREVDPRTIVRAWGAFVAELAPRASPILLLIRDAAATYSSAELYELLVLRRGWSPARYGCFVADAMIKALL